MAKKFQALRGMNDILPSQSPLWAGLEAVIRKVLAAYGYREMRLPLVENTELFRRSIGEVTDIVEKEMYSFSDREGGSMTLRPEATAGFVRAAVEHGLLHNQTQRLWTLGPMFRHERPQAGRYRQFHQLDVEAFGLPGPDIDAELILLSARLWRELGIDQAGLELQLNCLGSSEARGAYREGLVAYFESHRDVLDEDSRRRLQRNPLRILDSKNPAMADVVAGAPLLIDHLDEQSRGHFEGLQALLDAAGVGFTVNPRLVRGLDYYNRTVFEWVTGELGAQNAICGGGRYDPLVEYLGGRATPGIGFAVGLERLLMLLGERGYTGLWDQPHAYLVALGEAAERYALVLAERLRGRLPGLRLLMHCGGGSSKSQFKRADQSGARYALVLGETELGSARIGLKTLREAGEQRSLTEEQLIAFLQTEDLNG